MPELAKKEQCIGCTACASVCSKCCITMQADDEGFLYPVIDMEKCIGCKACKNVCPCLTPLAKAENGKHYFAAYTKDEVTRKNSSSGGVFTEIAKEILRQGGIVFGAAYNAQFDVEHIGVETEQELAKLRGAKYAQSALGDIYAKVKEQLCAGRKVVFVGTPCQVAGLRCFLQKPYDTLILIDLICHGAPSPTVWQSYRTEQQKNLAQGSDIVALNMRDKCSGWSRYHYSFRTQYANGVDHTILQGQDAFLRGFVQNVYLRPSCATCRFKSEYRASDITLGDYWGVWDHYPEFDDDKGVSLVTVNTQKGLALWKTIQTQLHSIAVTAEQAFEQNPSALYPSAPHEKRGVFFQGFSKHRSFAKAMKKIEKQPGFLSRLFKR